VTTDQPPAAEPGTELPGAARALLDAVMAISSDLDLHNVLTRIVESATSLTGARYGALGVVGAEDLLVEFVTTGVSEEERRRIGDLPHGRGILGLLITDPRPIRLRDLTEHASSYGFPPNHPAMGSFLGVPVRIRGTVFGNLYLTEKAGGGEFTDTDEQLVVALAGVAGLVIENARAYGLSERRREWLEAAASLPDTVQPPLDEEESLHRIVTTARRVARARAAAVVDIDTFDVRVLVCGPGEDVAALEDRVTRLAAQLGGLEVLDPVDVAVDDVMGTVVPLQAHLAEGGLLLTVHDRPDAKLRDVDDRELLRSFADYAALTLDRGRAVSEREELAVISDRERIARDLHDVVIQRLFATGMQLQAASMRATNEDVRGRIERTVADLDATIRDIRATIFELQAPASGSVRGELRALVREYRPVLGFVPELRVTGPVDTAVTGPLVEPLLKVLREALSNVARHAQASHVDVRVGVDGGELTLVVVDDGVGMPAGVVYSGLANARDRASSLGGELDVTPHRPCGVRLSWRVPLAR
jgi:signal transduction histidine kinase